MKTALVTTCWLADPINRQKTQKWVNYYKGDIAKDLKYDEIILLNNGFSLIREFPKGRDFFITDLKPHLPRASHLEYPYLWRALDHFQKLFEEYDKIIYMDNDFYILSKAIVDRVNAVSGPEWFSPWCKRHNFPETGLQVLTKDSVNYRIGQPWSRHNGKCMETTLPVDFEKNWNGDRHSEYGIVEQDKTWDFSAQVTLDMEMKYNLK